MHAQPARLIAGALALLLTGCATTSITSRLPVRGRTVELKMLDGEREDPIKGELLAVGPEGVCNVPRDGIERVRVQLHGLDGRKAGTWVVVGALVTGAALALACSSVDAGDCGAAFGAAALPWGLIGGPSAAGLAKSSRVFIERSELDRLQPYARFPQGLPEGLDPGRLVPAPGR
jgi:hypothetical protein